MSASGTLVEAIPPVPDLPEGKRAARRGRMARLWERNQTLIPTLAALVLLFGMLIYAEVAYGRVFHAGTMSSLLISFAPTIILAVVIGGTSLAGGKFSILGSTIGALLIATLNKTVLFLGIPAAATPAFKALVIIALVLLQSERIRSFAFGRAKPKGTPPGPAKADESAPVTKEKEVVA